MAREHETLISLFDDIAKSIRIKKNGYSLPNEYQEVEYIENTGTQYIDTNIVSNRIDEVDIIVSISNIYAIYQYFAGARNQINTAIGYALYFGEHGGLNYYPLRWSANGYSAEKNKIVHFNTTFKNGHSECKIDDNTVLSEDYNQDSYNTGNNVFIGAINETSEGDTGNYVSYARYYNAIFKKNDIIVANFIPCYRKSDNEIGLYDLVTETFYTNQGTDTFLKGQDVNKIVADTFPQEIDSIGVNDVEINNNFKLNQLVENGNFESTTGWKKRTSTAHLNASNNIISWDIVSINANQQIYHDIAIPVNHKFYFRTDVKKDETITTCSFGGGLYNGNTRVSALSFTTELTTEFQKYSFISTVSSDVDNVRLFPREMSDDAINNYVYARNCIVIDITEMFSIGNEPSTTEEVERYINQYIPYNTGQTGKLMFAPNN